MFTINLQTMVKQNNRLHPDILKKKGRTEGSFIPLTCDDRLSSRTTFSLEKGLTTMFENHRTNDKFGKEPKKLASSMKDKYQFLLLLLILTTGSLVNAQDTVRNVSYHGKLDSINSSILNQKRLIQVFTPPSYKPGSADKYDVLYVLDGGNWNTGLIARTQQFVEGEGLMPPTIIVSVLGIDRSKDLTPTRLAGWKTSGGADKFLGFIKNELIPYVNQTYPSNGDNTLWGHSLGGMFVMYAMLKEPTTFKSYIAVDPSMWWDKCYIPKMAAKELPALADL